MSRSGWVEVPQYGIIFSDADLSMVHGRWLHPFPTTLGPAHLPDDPPTFNIRLIRKISTIENYLATLMKSVKEGLLLQREFLLPAVHHRSVSGPQAGY
jgi:hypothetical protein